MNLEFSPSIFTEHSNMKFNENASSGIQVVPCGRTDVMKLMVAFCKFCEVVEKCDLEVKENLMRLMLINISLNVIPPKFWRAG